uniref:Tensin 3 n=1 Tax=Salarias fasciatus TaxID=181472 RepID=A0A672FK25_SALFA
MEERHRIDLTYITERIITTFCPPGCPEEAYLHGLQEIVHMLQSKHGHNYMVRRQDEHKLDLQSENITILDTGWVDQLAPGLDQIFNVCTAMESWLQSDQRHVLVLHCRGGKGRLGVLIASYIHFSNTSASADLSLDHFAMRRFYNDKLSALMTPSQKRYVWMLGSVLKGGLRMRPSPSFLLCVVLHGLPKIRPDGGERLDPPAGQITFIKGCLNRLYFVLQPAQLLNGDIMVVCYDKNSQSACRQVIFRLQFHTGLVVGQSLTFYKADLDCASHGISKGPPPPRSLRSAISLNLWHNGPCVTVDYDTLDPRVRRDSYQDASHLEAALPHLQEPGHGSLFAKVKKRSGEEGSLFAPPAGSLSCSDRTPSASSDSGLSVASQGLTAAKQSRGPQDKSAQAGKLVTGPNFEIIQPLLEMGPGDITGDESGLGHTINGEASSSERETDILEDEEEEEERDAAALGLEIPSSSSVCSLSSETQTGYSTHAWVQQQQQIEDAAIDRLDGPPPLITPDTPPRGLSSRDAVQRGLALEGADSALDQPLQTSHTHTCQDDEMASLATDIDDSIEQLNQLILDLDPTFVPVPTRCSPLSRSASLRTNGLSHKGKAHLSGKSNSLFLTYSRCLSVNDGPTGAFQRNRVLGNSAYLELSGFEPNSTRMWSVWQKRGRHHHIVDGSPRRHSNPTTAPRAVLLWSVSALTSFSFFVPCSSTPPSVWHERTPNSTTPNSMNSLYPAPQPSPPLSLSAPNAHSSPRGPLKGLGGSPAGVRREMTDSTDLSSLLLGNGGLEHSLLEAMEGLGSLNLGVDGGLAPLLPEKRRGGEGGELGSRSPSLSGFSSPHSGSSFSIPFSSSVSLDPLRGLSGTPSPDFGNKQDTVKFVQDTSKFWYKPDISRDQAIAVLKDKEPGSFIVRDSHSFRGAYGLAMKVATPPPSVLQQSKKVGDLSNELVRHFLIECTQKGVRLKGCPNEPYFGSLTALVCQHSITPLALPCKLILPDRDPVEELNNSPAQTSTNSAAELLKQGAACNVWYLGSVELESLTGHQAVQKATTQTLSMDPPPSSTVVHFKVSAQGITLTDNQRKLFFRRHYAVNTVIFCSLDPQGRKWTRDSGSTAKIFGFVARKSQSDTENMCHLFAEHDPEQPASAIVNFVSKVMIGSHKK